MKKIYGSLINRIHEGKTFVDEIKVGTPVTEYLWSDRHVHEVTKVIDQKHVFIREMEAIRTDKNGMSDSQQYRYESNENANEVELVKRGDVWYKVTTYTKELYEKLVKEYWCGWVLTESQWKRIDEGKDVKKYTKMNISFGIADYYYDFSF